MYLNIFVNQRPYVRDSTILKSNQQKEISGCGGEGRWLLKSPPLSFERAISSLTAAIHGGHKVHATTR